MRSRENPGTAVLLNVIPPQLTPRTIGFNVLEVAGAPLRAVWVGQGYPADIRSFIAQADYDAAAIPVITARRMSPGAREVLNEHGLSWADAAGYANITDGRLLHIVRLEPHPLRSPKTGDIVWSRSKVAVAEFLLSRRTQHRELSGLPAVGVDRLALISESTELSTAQIAKVLAEFDDLGYTAKVGPERGPSSSREMAAPGRLLSDWAGHYARSSVLGARAELQVPSRNPRDWLSLLHNQIDVSWAVSGWLAADVLAPLATSVPDVTVYVDERHFEAARRGLTRNPDVTEVERSGRIRLRTAPPSVFEFVREGGFPLVSPVRVYADLLRARGRGEDAAEHLREVAIGF